MKTCPACWSVHIERRRRRTYHHLLTRLFGIYPYLCNECGHQFLAIPLAADYRQSPHPGTPPSLTFHPISAKLDLHDSHPRMAP